MSPLWRRSKHPEWAGDMGCRFSVDADVIHYHSPWNDFEIRFSSIVLIAEETNDSGPFLDDYFFIFMVSDGDLMFRMSTESEGCDVVVRCLEEKLGPDLAWRLGSCTDVATNIVWPPRLAGNPLWIQAEPVGWRQSVLAYFGLWSEQNSVEYTDDVEQYFQELQEADPAI